MANVNFEIKILDENYQKIGFWKFNSKDMIKFFKLINSKYGLGLVVKKKPKDTRDLDWAK